MSDTCKVFDNLHLQCMCIWMCPNNISAAPADKALGSHLEIWVIPGQQMMVKCGDWGCRPNQDWSNINVRHMQCVRQLSFFLWFWIWMCPYNITASLIDQALGSHLEIWVIPGQQMMVQCSVWGCRPNQNWSHININVRHIWQTNGTKTKSPLAPKVFPAKKCLS
jgi:hypothetical protein